MGDDRELSEEYLADMEEKRERVERLFKEALDEVANVVTLSPNHEKILEDTKILLACETRPVLEEMISKEDEGLYHAEDGEKVVLTKHLCALDKRLQGDFSYMFTNKDGFSIVIGEEAEASSDEEYKAGLMAELAHVVVHTLSDFRADDFELDGSVSEFYDLALSWQFKRTTPKQLTALMRLSDFHVKNGHDREYVKDVARRAPKTMAIFGAEDSMTVTDVYKVLRSSQYRNQEHVGGASIGWRLATEIAERKECSVRDTLPDLTIIAGKAMYDNSVDFSSPEAFVESVSARLDEYLA